jgi:hypothetical protein
MEIGLRKVPARISRVGIAEPRSKVQYRGIGMEEKNAPNNALEADA